MRVSDVMTREVAVADIAATVRDVAGIMRLEDCGFVPIVASGRLAGVVTDRDLAVRCLADASLDGSMGELPITEVMTADDLVTVDPDDTLETAVHGVLSLGDLEQAMHGRGAAAREAVLAVTLPD